MIRTAIIWGGLTAATSGMCAGAGQPHLIPGALAVGMLWAGGAALHTTYRRRDVEDQLPAVVPPGVEGHRIGHRHPSTSELPSQFGTRAEHLRRLENARRVLAFAAWGDLQAGRPPRLPEGDFWDDRPEALPMVEPRTPLRKRLAARAYSLWALTYQGLQLWAQTTMPVPSPAGPRHAAGNDKDREAAAGYGGGRHAVEPKPDPMPVVAEPADRAVGRAAVPPSTRPHDPDWPFNTGEHDMSWLRQFDNQPDDAWVPPEAQVANSQITALPRREVAGVR